ncbi:hypothetical protein IFM89_010998 [Coptis chinensis]|uniref:Uncharacterized protein n=1 Tax=Coptis chinensis TaxID=261450 RepID=A0A835IRD6_9MAGN|nr:hypothetical protein IFM89_010998 [Coptis chinensis]
MDPEENFNRNTEVDETLDSNMDPEENFNSNTEVDETPDSNMEENVTQHTREKRKGRGAVVCSCLTKMKENERVDVVFNQNGQYIGEGGKDLASYSGLLAASRVSIATYDNWNAKHFKTYYLGSLTGVGSAPMRIEAIRFRLACSRSLLVYVVGIPIEDLQYSLTIVVVPENIVLPSGDAHLHAENEDFVNIV